MKSRNLRELLAESDKYHTYNREERYYAALLYHFLLKKTELKKFLLQKDFKEFIGQDYKESEVRIFFEYAHIRDLWFAAKEEKKLSNNDLRSVIIELLDSPEKGLNLSQLSDSKFNDYFGAKSEDQIQMPGRWSKKEYPKWVSDGGENFAKCACKLIWAFNAKADIVIHVGNKAICIEAKVESAESKYRASAGTGKKNDDFVMKQTEIQEFILTKLLGYDNTFFVFLSKTGKFNNEHLKSPSIGMRWNTIFDLMDNSNEFDFVKDSIQSKVIIDKKKNEENN